MDLRLPNITSTTAEGQIAQLQGYMYQMVQELNWALNTIGNAAQGNTADVSINLPNMPGGIASEEAQDTFNSIKDLIIKSADIVQAYEDTFIKHLNGKYFANSDFGTFIEQTNSKIEVNSTSITQYYSLLEEITNTVNNNIRATESYIRTGRLSDNVYGVEVGQTTDDGAFKKFARFTADKLSFYDENGIEVAYVSDQRLYITDAIFLGTLQLGGYQLDTHDGLAFTWIGG